MQRLHAVADVHQTGSVVLVVEDERVSRRALSALLSASGYDVEAAESAEEALRILRKQPMPGIALVDLDLPGMSGLDLIAQLEQMDPDVFPVLITAASGEKLATQLHELGIAYMRKPVDFDHLLSLLSERQLLH